MARVAERRPLLRAPRSEDDHDVADLERLPNAHLTVTLHDECCHGLVCAGQVSTRLPTPSGESPLRWRYPASLQYVTMHRHRSGRA